MKSSISASILSLLSLSFFATSTLGLPTTELEARQATSWNDIYIKEPLNFQLRNAESKCNVLFSFERDFVDSRYAYQFEARYPSGESKIITPVTEGLSGTRLPISRPGKNGDIGPYVIGNGYLLSVHSFSNVCSSSGAPPSSITAFTELGGGYTYKNKYNSGPIGYSADNTLPAVPTGVTATKSGKSTTVKWNAVEGATGYFVVYSSPFYASELGSDVQLLRTQIVGAGKTQDTQPVAASIVTVVARRGGAVSDTGKTGQFVPRSV